ncbi:MAG: T9SS type A sorting domain-containing protein [Bacteroidetes bacterium]|nr:T9SS type A sorting domain-containing protein [Bacteroidota bacterium]
MNLFTKLFFLHFLFSVVALSELEGQQYIWTQKASLPAAARHRCAVLNIGGRAYLGLGHYNVMGDVLFDDWWEYDPGTNSWTQKANFGGGKRLGPAYFTIGNKGYVGTGRDITGTNYNDLWEYDPMTNKWTQKASFAGSARRMAVGFPIGNKGYIGTGEGPTNYLASLWEYDPSTNSWTQKASYPPGGRFAATGFSIGNKGYLGTGEDNTGNSSNDFYEYDPATNVWTLKANVPGVAREAACGFSYNGKGYIGTGEDYQSGNSQSDFYEYDPTTNSWDTIANFAGTARRYMVGVSLGTRAYAGTGTSGNNFNDWWEYGNLSAVDELNPEDRVSIFPNPFSESAALRITNPGELQIEKLQIKVFDNTGKEILPLIIRNADSFVIRRGDIAAGIYFLRLISENKIIATKKFIIQ